MFGQKVLVIGVAERCFRTGVEHDDLAVQIERRHVLAHGHADALRIVAEIVDRRHAPVRKPDRAADLTAEIRLAETFN